MKKRYILASLTIHLLPLLFFVHFNRNDGNDNKSSGSGIQEVEIVSKISSPSLHSNDNCAKFYTGIGIKMNQANQVVYISEGYPADGSGINIGDYILTDFEQIKAKPIGTKVSIEYQNKLGTHYVDLILDKICIK